MGSIRTDLTDIKWQEGNMINKSKLVNLPTLKNRSDQFLKNKAQISYMQPVWKVKYNYKVSRIWICHPFPKSLAHMTSLQNFTHSLQELTLYDVKWKRRENFLSYFDVRITITNNTHTHTITYTIVHTITHTHTHVLT